MELTSLEQTRGGLGRERDLLAERRLAQLGIRVHGIGILHPAID